MIPSEREPEELAANRHVVLMADDAGYALWQLTPDVDEPMATFPATTEGSDDAWDAFARATWRARVARLLNGLLWTAGILGLISVVASLLNDATYALLVTRRLEDTPDWWSWVQVVSTTAWPAFLVTSGIYVLVWLQRHPKAGRRRFRPIEP